MPSFPRGREPGWPLRGANVAGGLSQERNSCADIKTQAIRPSASDGGMSVALGNGVIVSEPFIKTWFALQRQLIAGLQVAYIDLQGTGVSEGGLTVAYPEKPEHLADLALAAELARRSGAPVTGNATGVAEDQPQLRIAYPLHIGEHAEGAVVIEVEAPLHRQAKIIELLKWSEAWLKLALRQGGNASGQPAFGGLIEAGLAQEDYRDARTAVLALLPQKVACTRVALGIGKADRVRLLAVSDVPELGRLSARAKVVEDAMQEAADAAETRCWPQDAGPDASNQAQHDLVETGDLNGVCTVPIVRGLRQPLVFVFEFAEGKPWSEQARARCEEAARVAAPLLELRQTRDAPWLSRLGALLHEGLQKILGPKGRTRRIFLVTVVSVLAVLALGRGEYRVSAPAVIEGAVQRAVVAPFEGYIEQARVRAGQQVQRGDLLARLDDRDLQSERRSLVAEEAELSKQHRQAVALLDHGEAKVVEAQLAQTRAGLALIEDKLARTELRAPLDGLVISGDWSRSLGVPVSRGELMFEIAPLDDYRVAIQVSDREIAGLAAGQQGELILTALPRQPVQLSVSDITTLAAEEPGEPAFRVEAEVADDAPELRPGMEGVAKVTVGERRRWWIWTHALTDWLRLQLWRWLP